MHEYRRNFLERAAKPETGKMALLKCYNKGCGKDFEPEDNGDDSCQFHPGVPVFHDAYKGWSCCNKKSIDFTTFLGFPGCTKGPHSNVKPPEPEKPKPDPKIADEVIEVKAPKPEPKVREPRPSQDEPMIKLQPNVTKSAMQALERKLKEIGLLDINGDANSDQGSSILTVGTECKNGGCSAKYQGEESNTEVCIHHPGVPIFHEGLKFWSCCKKRTCDFEEWQKQVGCERGKHVWVKKQDAASKILQSCRFDYYQTGNQVIVSFYAKAPAVDKCSVELNRVSMKVHLEFDGGTSIFEKTFILNGVVNPAKSSVKLLGTKTEITLQKSGPAHWAELEL